jgi:60 kDa SS-A/Ro ribonucleoprotein
VKNMSASNIARIAGLVPDEPKTASVFDGNHSVAPIGQASRSTAFNCPSQKIDGLGQTPNVGGGHGWKLDRWGKVMLFLMIGSEGGTFYTAESKLTKNHAKNLLECISLDGLKVVSMIEQVSVAGRAPKQSPGIFALALCAVFGDVSTKTAAYHAVDKVCRTHATLLEFFNVFFSMREKTKGMSRGARNAVDRWYSSRDAGELAFQILKGRKRGDMTVERIIACGRPTPATPNHSTVIRWAIKGWDEIGSEPHPDSQLVRLWAFEAAKKAKTAKEVARLIRNHNLQFQMVPSNWHGHRVVWEALIERMPLNALIRNLGRLTANGMIAPLSDYSKLVVEKLTNQEALIKSRVHPFHVLMAQVIYAQGQGDKGGLTWKPDQNINSALDQAFFLSCGSIIPSGRRTLICLDSSGSMGHYGMANSHWNKVNGLNGVSAMTAGAAMALITARTEPNSYFITYDQRVYNQVQINSQATLSQVIASLPRSGNLTNCGAPMQWALNEKIPVDVFSQYTDGQTNMGTQHPFEALNSYRQGMGIDALMTVALMSADDDTITDPNDPKCMNIVGFDSGCPRLISEFVRANGYAGLATSSSKDVDDVNEDLSE